mgnify:CR=1 FL=1
MYVGQQPSSTFDSGIQDRFTGLSTNTVTLTHDISAETDILVVWNNIVQDSSTYSVGGTGNKTLTLGGTLVSADIVTVYYLNKVMQSVNPTAGSVNTDQLASSAVTDAKIADVAASKLTGTIATARLGSGTASSSTFLRGDNTFASAGESNDHYFFARGNGTQTISNGTDTTCEFNVLVDSLDSHSGYNTGTYRYTVQTGGAGLWYLKFGNYFNGANSWGGGEQIQMQLYGAGMNNHLYIDGSSGGNRTDGWLEVNALVKLAVGDQVRGVVWQNTGGNVTANNNNGNAIIGGFRVKEI